MIEGVMVTQLTGSYVVEVDGIEVVDAAAAASIYEAYQQHFAALGQVTATVAAIRGERRAAREPES